MPFGTGALPRPHDIRDYHLGLAGAPAQIPDSYLPDHSHLPIKFQGKYGTCGGHGGAALESFLEDVDLAPKFLWKQIKQIDGLPLDAGTNMRAIFKALQAKGVCHEALCPDVLDPTLAQYSDIKTVTDTMLNDAYPHGITSYAFIDNPTWDQIRQAIYQNKAVLARLDCGTGWYTPSWLEKDILPLKLGKYESGHFLVLWGYDQNYIYFRNSWSDTWGRKGDGYFDRSYLPHVTEIGTAIDGPSLKQTIVSLFTKLIFLLQQKLAGR
jgi:hypothetical protein